MEGGTQLHPSGVQSIHSTQCVSVIFHFIGIRKPAVSTYPWAVLMLETVIALSLWAPTGWEPKTTEMGFLPVLEAGGRRLEAGIRMPAWSGSGRAASWLLAVLSQERAPALPCHFL